jgi:hypothetical protein
MVSKEVTPVGLRAFVGDREHLNNQSEGPSDASAKRPASPSVHEAREAQRRKKMDDDEPEAITEVAFEVSMKIRTKHIVDSDPELNIDSTKSKGQDEPALSVSQVPTADTSDRKPAAVYRPAVSNQRTRSNAHYNQEDPTPGEPEYAQLLNASEFKNEEESQSFLLHQIKDIYNREGLQDIATNLAKFAGIVDNLLSICGEQENNDLTPLQHTVPHRFRTDARRFLEIAAPFARVNECALVEQLECFERNCKTAELCAGKYDVKNEQSRQCRHRLTLSDIPFSTASGPYAHVHNSANTKLNTVAPCLDASETAIPMVEKIPEKGSVTKEEKEATYDGKANVAASREPGRSPTTEIQSGVTKLHPRNLSDTFSAKLSSEPGNCQLTVTNPSPPLAAGIASRALDTNMEVDSDSDNDQCMSQESRRTSGRKSIVSFPARHLLLHAVLVRDRSSGFAPAPPATKAMHHSLSCPAKSSCEKLLIDVWDENSSDDSIPPPSPTIISPATPDHSLEDLASSSDDDSLFGDRHKALPKSKVAPCKRFNLCENSLVFPEATIFENPLHLLGPSEVDPIVEEFGLSGQEDNVSLSKMVAMKPPGTDLYNYFLANEDEDLIGMEAVLVKAQETEACTTNKWLPTFKQTLRALSPQGTAGLAKAMTTPLSAWMLYAQDDTLIIKEVADCTCHLGGSERNV